jgi:transcriptional regulator with XRE-family HTH domain
MKNTGTRISQLRKSKGLSQEELAESAGVNLRTIQRIESGENEPHGNTLRSICEILEVQVDEIYSFDKEENYNYIASVHFSALIFLLFPLGNIILPLILWFARKDKILNLSYFTKNLLNFQLTWTMLTYWPFALMFIQSFFHIKIAAVPRGNALIIFIGIMYGINLAYTIMSGLISLKGGNIVS